MNKKLLIGLVVVNFFMLAGIAFFKYNHKTVPNQPPVIQQPDQDPPPPTIKSLSAKEARETITESEITDMLTWLAHDDREGRMSGKKGNVAAAEYIKKEFESYGLKTEMQKFNIRRMNPGPKNETGDDFTHNIIGILPGKTDRVIIIGGHMDHIGYGPQMSRFGGGQIHNGADDNASGSTAVLEIAEAFSSMFAMKVEYENCICENQQCVNYKKTIQKSQLCKECGRHTRTIYTEDVANFKMDQPEHTIVFICFSAEEMGLIGSRHYVSQLSKAELAKIDLMVNFDMVGWLKDQKSVTISGIKPIPELVSIVEKLNPDYPVRFVPGSSGSGGSDHASFGNAGVPYAFFHTGLHDHYHKPSDDVDKIDFKGQTVVTKFAFEMIYEFDKAKLTRKVSMNYPALNDFIHDHGHPETPFPHLHDKKGHHHD